MKNRDSPDTETEKKKKREEAAEEID